MKSALEQACEVWWGQSVDPDDIQLRNQDSPESRMILKDNWDKLSTEAKEVASIIVNLPDEMFTGTGRIINEKLLQYMKINHGWSAKKTSYAKQELFNLL